MVVLGHMVLMSLTFNTKSIFRIFIKRNQKKNEHARTCFEKPKDQNHIIFFTWPKTAPLCYIHTTLSLDLNQYGLSC